MVREVFEAASIMQNQVLYVSPYDKFQRRFLEALLPSYDVILWARNANTVALHLLLLRLNYESSWAVQPSWESSWHPKHTSTTSKVNYTFLND